MCSAVVSLPRLPLSTIAASSYIYCKYWRHRSLCLSVCAYLLVCLYVCVCVCRVYMILFLNKINPRWTAPSIVCCTFKLSGQSGVDWYWPHYDYEFIEVDAKCIRYGGLFNGHCLQLDLIWWQICFENHQVWWNYGQEYNGTITTGQGWPRDLFWRDWDDIRDPRCWDWEETLRVFVLTFIVTAFFFTHELGVGWILINGFGSGQYQPDKMTSSARATDGRRLHNADYHSYCVINMWLTRLRCRDIIGRDESETLTSEIETFNNLLETEMTAHL